MATNPPVWHTERRKLADLIPHQKNPREPTARGVEALRGSLDRNGYFDTIAINLDNVILSGHRRTEELIRRGEIEVDVRVPDRLLTDEEAEDVLIAANAAIVGIFSMEKLANEFDMDSLKKHFDDATLGLNEEGPRPPESETQQVRPFKAAHALLSYPPEEHPKVVKILEQLRGVRDMEIKTATN